MIRVWPSKQHKEFVLKKCKHKKYLRPTSSIFRDLRPPTQTKQGPHCEMVAASRRHLCNPWIRIATLLHNSMCGGIWSYETIEQVLKGRPFQINSSENEWKVRPESFSATATDWALGPWLFGAWAIQSSNSARSLRQPWETCRGMQT